MSYKVSIIVPHYKTELYIRKCVDSILSQTLKEFELILVDDGSPDRCGEICDDYSQRDSRVKVIHKENGGYSSAINAGLDIAQGEYIGIVDGDDYIEKDMYETLYDLAKKYEADVVECNVHVVKDNDISPVSQIETIQVGDNLYALDRLIRWSWNSVLWNKIYRREVFSKLRLPYGKTYSDSWIIYKIYLCIKKYVYTGKCKYFYFRRDGSVMAQSKYSLKRLEGLECHEERFFYLKYHIKDESILEQVEYKYFQEILYHHYMLCINKQLDPSNELKEIVRKHILNNYRGFMKNNLLRRDRIWMILASLNGTLFKLIYRLYLPIYNYFYESKCRLSIFIRKYTILRKFQATGK